jgi:hypothetical protein
MQRKSAIVLGLAISVSLSALTLVPEPVTAQGVSGAAPAPAMDTIAKTYTKADEAWMAQLPLVDIRAVRGTGGGTMVPKGAAIREIRIFGAPAITGIQIVYEDAGGSLFETAIAGAAAPQVATLTLADGETIAAVSVTSDDASLRSLQLVTSTGRKVQAGTLDGARKALHQVPGQLLGFVLETTDRIISIMGLVRLENETARTYVETLNNEGQPTYRGADRLGYSPEEAQTLGGDPANPMTALIPKGMELAAITVFGEQRINGVQLAYRSPGTTPTYPTAVVGKASGKARTINFLPGETIEYVVKREDAIGVYGLYVKKSTGAEITFGAWDKDVPAAEMHAQGFGATSDSQTAGIRGFWGSEQQGSVADIWAMRLPQAKSLTAQGSTLPNRMELACSNAAADATTTSGPDPKSVIQARAKGVVLQRQFAAIQLDETQAAAAAQKFGRSIDACRFTIDGVWTTLDPIVPNDALGELLPGNVTSDSNTLISNGNYTSREYLIISNSADADNQIALMDALGDGTKLFLNSTDGISMGDLLAQKLPVSTEKVFSGRGASVRVRLAPAFRQIQIFVNRNGETKQFYRPTIKTSNQPVPINDTFVISMTLDNIAAAYRGYDITRDDPFFINNNRAAMWPIFQAANNLGYERVEPVVAYELTEKQAVPVGIFYVPDGGSGMISTDTLITSGTEYQKSVSSSYGASLGYGKSPTESQANAGKKAVGASIAVDVTNSNTKGMREGSTAGMAWGKAITKKYATVVNHAYGQLTTDFIDDLYDAANTGNFSTFIKRYGTHYAYAVTYGQASRSEETFDQQTTADWASSNFSVSVKLAGEAKGVSGSASYSRSEDTSNSSNLDTSIKKSTLVSTCTGAAVGNAQQGEKDCPVLLDLRPIYELVSPMYFPDSNEWVYNTRRQLTSAVEQYLAWRASSIEYDAPLEVWRVGLKKIKCTSLGSELGSTADLQGVVSFDVTYPLPPVKGVAKQFVRSAKGFNKSEGYLELACDSKWVDSPGTMPVMISGQRGQLLNAKVRSTIESLTEVDDGVVDPNDVLVTSDSVLFGSQIAFEGVATAQPGSVFTKDVSIYDGASSGDPVLHMQYEFMRIR